MRRMQEDAAALREREQELERSYAKLRRNRDQAIIRAVAGGIPLRDVGEAFGMSRERVRRIAHESKRE